MTGFYIGLGLAAVATVCGVALRASGSPKYRLSLYTGLLGLLLNGGSLWLLK